MTDIELHARCDRCGRYRHAVRAQRKPPPCKGGRRHTYLRSVAALRAKVALEQRVVDLYTREMLSSGEIEKRLNVPAKTVLRILEKCGVPRRAQAVYMTPEKLERAQKLRAEGVLARWIEEDIDVPFGALTDVVRNEAATAEWRPVWHEIRKHPELLALHREFAPQNSKLAA